MPVTKEMQKALSSLARAANRRIERATPGQRLYMQMQIKHYHVRERMPGLNVFKQGKAANVAEYRARMRELQAFMNARSTTRKGWDAIKAAQVAAAGKTLRGQGSVISDEELTVLLEEIGEGHSSAEYYKALANVEISKREDPDYWISADRDQIIEAMNARRSAQERTETLLRLRLRGR